MITAGEFVSTIGPISSRCTDAALTGVEPAKVRTVRMSDDNAAILASAATAELITVMLDPVSSQKSYSLPFTRTRITGVPTAVTFKGSITVLSGKVATSAAASANAFPQLSRSLVIFLSSGPSFEFRGRSRSFVHLRS